MADITVAIQNVVPTGLTVTHLGSLSLANTYKVRNDGRTFVRIVNGGAGASIATVAAPGTVGGLAIADQAVSIGAGVEKNIGPFPPSIYNDGNGDVSITFDVITSVTIAAMHLG